METENIEKGVHHDHAVKQPHDTTDTKQDRDERKSFFPHCSYQQKTSKELNEIYVLLNNLLKSNKYEGYWENNYLILCRTWQPGYRKRQTCKVKIKIINTANERWIHLHIDPSKGNIIFICFSIILSFLEILILYYMYTNSTLNIVSFVPVLLGFMVYCIIRVNNRFEFDHYKYLIKKTMK